MTKRRIAAYVDGGCPDNGRQAKIMFGSYIVYDLTGSFIDVQAPGIHEQLFPLPTLLEDIRFDLTSAIKSAGVVRTSPQKTTNNSAEALSLLCLLSELGSKKLLVPGNEVTIFMDSELTMYQVLRLYQVRQPHLKAIHTHIQAIFAKHHGVYRTPLTDVVDFKWIPGDTMKQTKIGH